MGSEHDTNSTSSETLHTVSVVLHAISELYPTYDQPFVTPKSAPTPLAAVIMTYVDCPEISPNDLEQVAVQSAPQTLLSVFWTFKSSETALVNRAAVGVRG